MGKDLNGVIDRPVKLIEYREPVERIIFDDEICSFLNSSNLPRNIINLLTRLICLRANYDSKSPVAVTAEKKAEEIKSNLKAIEKLDITSILNMLEQYVAKKQADDQLIENINPNREFLDSWLDPKLPTEISSLLLRLFHLKINYNNKAEFWFLGERMITEIENNLKAIEKLDITSFLEAVERHVLKTRSKNR